MEIEKELLSRFDGLKEHLFQAEQENTDPTAVAAIMHSEIDACLDRLNGIKSELTYAWQERST
jgi:hypothetical protein